MKLSPFSVLSDKEMQKISDAAMHILENTGMKIMSGSVRDMLKAEGCDLIICLSHLGITSEKINDFILAERVPGIDLIIGGHSHSEMAQPKMVGNTRVYQMAGKGKCVGEITVKY